MVQQTVRTRAEEAEIIGEIVMMLGAQACLIPGDSDKAMLIDAANRWRAEQRIIADEEEEIH